MNMSSQKHLVFKTLYDIMIFSSDTHYGKPVFTLKVGCDITARHTTKLLSPPGGSIILIFLQQTINIMAKIQTGLPSVSIQVGYEKFAKKF